MKEIVTCPICGLEFELEDLYFPCPNCDFEYEGIKDYSGIEDEKDTPNSPSYREAKERYRNGLNAYGKPLPKRN